MWITLLFITLMIGCCLAVGYLAELTRTDIRPFKAWERVAAGFGAMCVFIVLMGAMLMGIMLATESESKKYEETHTFKYEKIHEPLYRLKVDTIK